MMPYLTALPFCNEVVQGRNQAQLAGLRFSAEKDILLVNPTQKYIDI